MSRNLKDYLPKELIVGSYTYEIIIKSLREKKENNYGLCNFSEKQIFLSDELEFDLDSKNWKITIETFLHECLHAYDELYGLHSDFYEVKKEQMEEMFVDFHARILIQMIPENPSIVTLLTLLLKS